MSATDPRHLVLSPEEQLTVHEALHALVRLRGHLHLDEAVLDGRIREQLRLNRTLDFVDAARTTDEDPQSLADRFNAMEPPL